MMPKLKQYRVKAALTQAKLAKAVGVSQPNYQRWESGVAPIPEDKLKKLSKILEIEADVLMGTHKPIDAGLYDKSVGEDLSYYGEVAIHFQGSGKPVLLAISDGAFTRLHWDLQMNPTFVTVEGLANQTFIIRTQAIADLYFSSEAYDDYGPEHGHYENYVDLQMPDSRDWEIVQALASDGVGLEDFFSEDVQRVSERVMITDEQYEKLVADGLIERKDLELEKAKNQDETDKIFDLATYVAYQLSSGKLRSVCVEDSDEELFRAFEPFLEDCGDDLDDGLIRLSIAGWHRTAFINPQAIDFVRLPTHILNRGRTDLEAKFLDELG